MESGHDRATPTQKLDTPSNRSRGGWCPSGPERPPRIPTEQLRRTGSDEDPHVTQIVPCFVLALGGWQGGTYRLTGVRKLRR